MGVEKYRAVVSMCATDWAGTWYVVDEKYNLVSAHFGQLEAEEEAKRLNEREGLCRFEVYAGAEDDGETAVFGFGTLLEAEAEAAKHNFASVIDNERDQNSEECIVSVWQYGVNMDAYNLEALS